MKKHSCGALLYTVHLNEVYIILGKEYNNWFPFKGVQEKQETLEEAAIREIKEETCKVVDINNIRLDCKYMSYRKYYHIGLVYVDKTIIPRFYSARKHMTERKYLEKHSIKMFRLKDIHLNNLHHVTIIPIIFYWGFLQAIEKSVEPKLAPVPNRSLKEICQIIWDQNLQIPQSSQNKQIAQNHQLQKKQYYDYIWNDSMWGHSIWSNSILV